MRVSREGVSSTEIQDYGEDSFIPYKLVINYFSLMDIKLQPIQFAFINAALNPQYKQVVAALSRRTGKTFVANALVSLKLLMPGTRSTIIAPNYSLASISWDIQTKTLKALGIGTSRDNAKDRLKELVNESVLKLASASQADSTVGVSNDILLFDEAALTNKMGDIYLTQLLPTLDKKDSKAFFISTPRGRNSFWEFYQRGWDNSGKSDAWVSLFGTYVDNLHTEPEVIEEAKRSMSEAQFSQEFECSFAAQQGLIWNLRQQHRIEREDTPDMVIGGADIGFRDATAFVVVYCYDDGTFHIKDSYTASGKTTEEYATRIKDLCDQHGIDYVYIDAAAQQTKYDFAMLYDISTVNAKKSILDGIGYVGSLIDNGRLTVNPACSDVLDSIDSYQWLEETNDSGTYTQEKPKHNKASHFADAIRYALFSHQAVSLTI